MIMPSITAPAGTPVFLAAGHRIDEDSVFSPVMMASGHSRQRRRWTVPERVVAVSWLLTTDQLAVVDAWLDETLEAGTLPFAARVANQEDGTALLWWHATWITWSIELIPGGYGRLTGSLLLQGEGSETGPA